MYIRVTFISLHVCKDTLQVRDILLAPKIYPLNCLTGGPIRFNFTLNKPYFNAFIRGANFLL